jgi:hypothetical protein
LKRVAHQPVGVGGVDRIVADIAIQIVISAAKRNRVLAESDWCIDVTQISHELRINIGPIAFTRFQRLEGFVVIGVFVVGCTTGEVFADASIYIKNH